MRAINRHLDNQRDKAVAAAVAATNQANANPEDQAAQQAANRAGDVAAAARRIADDARYNR